MNKEKKILIIGIGSIGLRHLKNLLNLGYKDISLVRRNGIIHPQYPNLPTYSSINNACKKTNYDYAFISTPTAIHYQNLIELAQNNISNIYIEKPITNTLREAKEVQKIFLEKETNIVVGFDLRFDLGLNKVKSLITKEIIGSICSFQVEVGQYLPDWRPNEDYRKGMSAKKSLGGGVMLDLIHEFDYINWLLGPIESVFGKNDKISNLEIETEDVSVNILQTRKGVLGIVYLDYLQKKLSRECKIVGNDGVIIWNYKEAKVKWITHGSNTWKQFKYKQVERNDRFISIIKAFMESPMLGRDERLSNIKTAIDALALVEKSKLSNIENKLLDL